MEQSNTNSAAYLLEQRQVFSQSMLWDIQQRYFTEQGINAWRWEEVPFYVTSNPIVASSYASIVFALWRDHSRLTTCEEQSKEPLFVCELEAGSGRFAFHFLRQLSSLCEQAQVIPTSFQYGGRTRMPVKSYHKAICYILER